MSGFNIKAMDAQLQKYLPEKLDDAPPDVCEGVHLLLEGCLDALRTSKPISSEVICDLQAIVDFTWEKLNSGHWSDVPLSQRNVYAVASLLKSIAIVRNTLYAETKSDIKVSLQNALKAADMGLLLGAAFREELAHIARILSSAIDVGSEHQLSCKVLMNDNVEDSKLTDKVKIQCKELDVFKCPSLEYFHLHHFKPRIPVKITGCMSHWPALRKWLDVSYFRQLAGSRTVPVELGSNYLESSWSQCLMTLNSFIDRYIDSSSVSQASSECAKHPIAYLAQHQLFDQIPELKNDIFEPEYCCITENPDIEAEETDINAWFGPAGTVSPLHHDPKHNFLCQVVGCKRIVLFSPDDSAKLYPHEGTLVSNSAQVDPENPDFEKYPEFKKVIGFKCTLNAGEMLYMPPKWWHHVRSLSTSFSVSFWWQ